jgi:hypothetical protein
MTMDGDLLERFLDLAVDRLDGDWVIIGGRVLPLVDIQHRVTLDIDVVGPEWNQQTLELLQIAVAIGLAPEAVNQAAAFFLHRIPGWGHHLIPVRKGLRATFHRPDSTLYVLLKLARLTATDLQDCMQYLQWAGDRNETIEADVLRQAVDRELGAGPGPEKRERLEALRAVLP